MPPIGLKTSRSISALEKGEAKLWVLLVGINQYQDPRLSPLRYAATDCQKLGEALLVATRLFPEKEILTYHDFSEVSPNLDVIRKSLTHITKAAKDRDTVLFYFSGHGLLDQASNQTVLCLKHTNKDDLLNTGLKLQELLNLLSHCAAHKQLVWLDSCHSGNMTRSGAKGDTPNSDPTPQMMELLRQRTAKSKGFYALLSCDQGQSSWEFPELGHGVFTYYLMRGLQGEAANSRGILDADDLYRYVYEHTLDYIEKANQQIKLVNQQKQLAGEINLSPEYSLQTPKRIVEGVGELILGFQPDADLEILPLKQEKELITEFKTKLKISLSPEEYNRIQVFLIQMIGPIAPILLQQALANSTNHKDFVNKLSRHLPPNQRPVFANWIENLWSNQPVAKLTQPKISKNSIEQQQYKQIELFLKDLIGPIATTLWQQNSPKFSTSESILTALATYLTPSQHTAFEQWLAINLPSQPTQKTQLLAFQGSRSRGLETNITERNLQQCEQTLTIFLGPIAKLVIAKTIKNNPQLSYTELLDLLAEKIPNAFQAQEFKKIMNQ